MSISAIQNFKKSMKAHNNRAFVEKDVVTVLFSDGTRLMAKRSQKFVRLSQNLYYWHEGKKYFFPKLTLATNGINYLFFDIGDKKKLAVKKNALHGKINPVYDIPNNTPQDKLWVLPITLFNYAANNS